MQPSRPVLALDSPPPPAHALVGLSQRPSKSREQSRASCARLPSAFSFLLQLTAHFSPLTSHVSLFLLRFLLHASCSTLHASRFTLHAPRFTLHAPRSTLHASRFTLLAPRSPPMTAR